MTKHEPLLSGTKLCTYCKIIKPVICFSVDSTKPDGLSTLCRDCKRTKGKYYKAKNYKTPFKVLLRLDERS